MPVPPTLATGTGLSLPAVDEPFPNCPYSPLTPQQSTPLVVRTAQKSLFPPKMLATPSSGATTVTVNLWTASGATPFDAVNMIW